VNQQTTTIRITHSWCLICQAHDKGRARCGTPRGMGVWPAGTREQPCVVCAHLEPMRCELCGGDQ
jgi:hypothetical protein